MSLVTPLELKSGLSGCNRWGLFVPPPLCFGPKSPGEGKNWLATIPGKGWFTIFRLYGPKKEFFDRTWKLNDIEKMK